MDGQPATSLKPKGSAWYEVTGLARQRHVVRVEKVTESVDYRGAFLGFRLRRMLMFGSRGAGRDK